MFRHWAFGTQTYYQWSILLYLVLLTNSIGAPELISEWNCGILSLCTAQTLAAVKLFYCQTFCSVLGRS